MKFYHQSIAKLMESYLVDIKKGLTFQKVLEQRETHGENKLPKKEEIPYWKIFCKSFKEPIVIVLIMAIVLSFYSAYYDLQIKGDTKHGVEAVYEGIAIFILIIINACLSFWQEISAKKSLDALKKWIIVISQYYVMKIGKKSKPKN